MNTIKYTDRNTGIVITKKVSSIFLLAILPNNYKLNEKFYGLCIGVAIPHNNYDDFKDFYKSFLGTPENYISPCEENIIVYLSTDKMVSMPTLFSDGNGYEPDMGTSCIFVYSSDLIGKDEPPKMKHFGSHPLFFLFPKGVE